MFSVTVGAAILCHRLLILNRRLESLRHIFLCGADFPGGCRLTLRKPKIVLLYLPRRKPERPMSLTYLDLQLGAGMSVLGTPLHSATIVGKHWVTQQAPSLPFVRSDRGCTVIDTKELHPFS